MEDGHRRITAGKLAGNHAAEEFRPGAEIELFEPATELLREYRLVLVGVVGQGIAKLVADCLLGNRLALSIESLDARHNLGGKSPAFLKIPLPTGRPRRVSFW